MPPGRSATRSPAVGVGGTRLGSPTSRLRPSPGKSVPLRHGLEPAAVPPLLPPAPTPVRLGGDARTRPEGPCTRAVAPRRDSTLAGPRPIPGARVAPRVARGSRLALGLVAGGPGPARRLARGPRAPSSAHAPRGGEAHAGESARRTARGANALSPASPGPRAPWPARHPGRRRAGHRTPAADGGRGARPAGSGPERSAPQHRGDRARG